MSTTNHTPTPWVIETPMDFELAIVESGKQAHEWKFIATIPLSTDEDEFPWSVTKANATFIVRAVNAHDELVAALRCLLGAASTAGATGVMGTDELRLLHLAMSDARAALAKVQS